MSVPPRDAAHLWDMLQRAKVAADAASTMSQSDLTIFSAQSASLERWIEIVGEAARKVSSEFKLAHPEISWKTTVATRHVIAHDYGKLKYETIWPIATVYLPELVRLLEPLVPEPPADPEP